MSPEVLSRIPTLRRDIASETQCFHHHMMWPSFWSDVSSTVQLNPSLFCLWHRQHRNCLNKESSLWFQVIWSLRWDSWVRHTTRIRPLKCASHSLFPSRLIQSLRQPSRGVEKSKTYELVFLLAYFRREINLLSNLNLKHCFASIILNY